MSKTQYKGTRHMIKSFEAKALKKRPSLLKFADYLTSYFGSFGFLFINIIVFIFWVLANLGKIPGVPIFDPFPFVLLITAVSLEAIILTSIVLISQNRQSQIATLRDELQLQVELISEKEITKILSLLKKLIDHHGIEIDDPELSEMLKKVDTSYIERRLYKQLTPKKDPLAKKVTTPIAKAGEKLGKTLTTNINN